MLTKSDVEKIRGVIREEVEVESQNTRTELGANLRMSSLRMSNEISGLKDRLKNLEIKATQIQKDLRYAVDFLDREGLKVNKRIERLEEHLNLSPQT